MNKELLPQGADLCSEGVRYRVWAPEHQTVEVAVMGDGGAIERLFRLHRDAAGYHTGVDPASGAGTRYKYRLDGGDAFPDPASRWQPEGVHGPSAVIDPSDFRWSDREWKRPEVRDLVIYETHVGTFTPGGTFLSVIDRLPQLRELGVNTIELMPVADFPGERNWGYDGVCLYAPSRAYGHPDDLRALVDAAHGVGLAVILDVVYNHFGPDGNYLWVYTKRFFNEDKHTPWGAANNFDGEDSGPVRAFFVSNPLYWMDEFHIDGFRFDATHAINDESPRHILEEMTDAIHERGGFAIAEDSQNEAKFLVPTASAGYGFDGVWADDFHHVIRVGQTGEDEGYYGDYTGTLAELIETLRHGWLYRGQLRRRRRVKRGTECRHIPPERFVHCISNHDQIGNRAFGERLTESVSPEAYRAVSALLCLTPYLPMLFMGQEWAASTPFLFFTDHNEELGKLVTAGRRKEFEGFKAFTDPEIREKIPDPQAESTWRRSVLDWSELERPEHAGVLALYRACLELRNLETVFRPKNRDSWQVEMLGFEVGALRYKSETQWLILFDLQGGHEGPLSEEWLCKLRPGENWEEVLSTNEVRFGGRSHSSFQPGKERVKFDRPETLILRSTRS